MMNTRLAMALLTLTSVLAQAQAPEQIVRLDPLSPPTIAANDNCEDLVIRTALPEWPKKALREGTSGWTVVRYDVDATGQARNVNVEMAAPEQVFDKSAVSAVQRSRFKPGLARGECKMLLIWSLN
jgi:protein TonB